MGSLAESGARERAAQRQLDAFRSYLWDQRQLQRSQGPGNPAYKDPFELEGEEKVEFIRWNILAAIRELTEMLNLVDGWKPWQTKRDNVGTFKDRDDFVEEGIDVLHFVGNLLNAAHATDAELSGAFREKQRINAERQATGYAGDGKDWDAEHRSGSTVIPVRREGDKLVPAHPCGGQHEPCGPAQEFVGNTPVTRHYVEDFLGHGEGSKR
jgi:hypothetical protein